MDFKGQQRQREDSQQGAADAAAHAVNAGFDAHASASVQDAVHDIAAREAPGRILICGSLYLAGHVLGMEA